MSGQDTSIGRGQTAFARTQWTRLLSLRHTEPQAARRIMEDLASAYWRPVYRFIRTRKSNEEAKDLTQEFFATVFGPEFVARADPGRGSFRTFLLASLKNFLKDGAKREGAVKRGGEVVVVPIEASGEEPAAGSDPEREFMKTWAEGLLDEALALLKTELEARGRGPVFAVFAEHCRARPTYREIAERTGLSVSEVTNFLFEARRKLREILETKAAEYCESGESAAEELRMLFGA